MDASSPLRKVENVFYPPALRVAGPSSSHAKVVPQDLEPSQAASAGALPTSTLPLKEANQTGAMEKDKEPVKELAKFSHAPKDPSKEKRASQGQELVLVILPFTSKEDLKDKGTT